MEFLMIDFAKEKEINEVLCWIAAFEVTEENAKIDEFLLHKYFYKNELRKLVPN